MLWYWWVETEVNIIDIIANWQMMEYIPLEEVITKNLPIRTHLHMESLAWGGGVLLWNQHQNKNVVVSWDGEEVWEVAFSEYSFYMHILFIHEAFF